MDLSAMMENARRKGLDGIAITDHDSIEACEEAEAYSRPGFHVIPGIEVNSKIGDVIGLYVREPIESRDPVEVVKEIQAQDGIAILPHPFRHPAKIPIEFFELLDGIEYYNSRYVNTVRKYKQIIPADVFDLAKKFKLALIGVSDAHTLAEIGRGTTIIPGNTEDEVKRAIRNRSVVVGRKTTPAVKKVTSVINKWMFPDSDNPLTHIIDKGDYLTTEREGVESAGLGKGDYPDVFEFEREGKENEESE